MIRLTKNFATWSFLLFLIFGCAHFPNDSKDHEDVIEMLSVLTSFAQGALQKGYFEDGEQDFLEYLAAKKPKLNKWFVERGYTIRAAEVADHAVIMICYGDKAIFEDTDCVAGKPDRDYRKNLNHTDCEITMTKEEVKKICQ